MEEELSETIVIKEFVRLFTNRLDRNLKIITISSENYSLKKTQKTVTFEHEKEYLSSLRFDIYSEKYLVPAVNRLYKEIFPIKTNVFITFPLPLADEMCGRMECNGISVRGKRYEYMMAERKCWGYFSRIKRFSVITRIDILYAIANYGIISI